MLCNGPLWISKTPHNEAWQNKSGCRPRDSSHLEIRIPSHGSVLLFLFAIIVTPVSIPESRYSLCNQLITTKLPRLGLFSLLIASQSVALDCFFSYLADFKKCIILLLLLLFFFPIMFVFFICNNYRNKTRGASL